jgi:hypothetical protein
MFSFGDVLCQNIVLDRPFPPLDGAGAPGSISLPCSDAGSGVDLSTLRFSLNGRTYGAGDGAR